MMLSPVVPSVKKSNVKKRPALEDRSYKFKLRKKSKQKPGLLLRLFMKLI